MSKKKKPSYLKDKAVKQNSLFNFRKYNKVEGGVNKKVKHPKLIVEESENEFGFMGLTESEKRGHHSNIKLKVNPQKGNKDNAFLRKELRRDSKSNFSEILHNYNLSDEDKIAVIEFIKKRKKNE